MAVAAVIMSTISLRGQDVSRHPGLYRESTGDIGTESLPFYFWYAYKYVHPVKSAPAQILNYFKNQDLHFGKFFNGIPVESSARIVAVGDMMVKTRMTLGNSSHLFDDIGPDIQSADIAYGNLEGPAVPARQASAFPRYNFGKQTVELFKAKGFEVVSTANNHSLDQGPEGLAATLDFLDQLGIKHVGTSRTAQERESNIPIINANGIKVAFLSYTFGTNGRKIPQDKPWMVNLVEFNLIKGEPDLYLVKRDIAAARKLGADVVVVAPHWSLEYEFYPTERLVKRGHEIIEMGADIILGSHAHCLQPMERYIPTNPERVGLPEAFIIYSLGNFIPDHPQVDFRTTVLLGITLKKGMVAGKEKIWIDSIDAKPLFFSTRDGYRLIRIDRALNNRSGYPFLKRADFKNLERARNIISSLFLPNSLAKNQ